jgi:hypothetical protein
MKIANFVRFTTAAVDHFGSALPTREKYKSGKAGIIEGFRKIAAAFEPPLDLDFEALEKAVDSIADFAEPRRFRDIAPDKVVTASELVDLPDREAAMRKLRLKVAKDVLNSSAREMFLSYLGKKFGLFREEDLGFGTGTSKWSIKEIEATWAARHRIVHEGQLPLTEEHFDTALTGFLWLVLFLAVRCRKKYAITTDGDLLLDSWATTFKIG